MIFALNLAAMNIKSIWAGVTKTATFTPLQNNLTVDVAIVSGGITSITAAYLLAKAGKRVERYWKRGT